MCVTLSSNMKGETWRRGEGPDVRTPGPPPPATLWTLSVRTDGRRRNAPQSMNGRTRRKFEKGFFCEWGWGGLKRAPRHVTSRQRKHTQQWQQQQQQRAAVKRRCLRKTSNAEPLTVATSGPQKHTKDARRFGQWVHMGLELWLVSHISQWSMRFLASRYPGCKRQHI